MLFPPLVLDFTWKRPDMKRSLSRPVARPWLDRKSDWAEQIKTPTGTRRAVLGGQLSHQVKPAFPKPFKERRLLRMHFDKVEEPGSERIKLPISRREDREGRLVP